MAEAKVDTSATSNLLEQQLDALLTQVQSGLEQVQDQLDSTPSVTNAEDTGTSQGTEQAVATPEELFDMELQAELELMTSSIPDEEIIAKVESVPVTKTPENGVSSELSESPAVEEEPAGSASEASPAPQAVEAVAVEEFAADEPEVDEALEAAVGDMVADATAALAVAEGEVEASTPVQSHEPIVAPETAPETEPVPAPLEIEPPAPKTSAPVQASSLEDLDSQLASLTEQMLSEPTPGIGGSPQITGIPLPPSAAPAKAVSVEPLANETVPKINTSTSGAPGAADQGAGAHGQHASHGSHGTKLASEPSRAGAIGQELLLRVFSPLSSSLNRYPKVVRDTLGWVALITLFWAGTIWAYLLFFHKPVDADIPHSAPHIAGAVGHAEPHGGGEKSHGSPGSADANHSNAPIPGHSQGHEAGGTSAVDAHGKAPTSPDAHKTPAEHGDHGGH